MRNKYRNRHGVITVMISLMLTGILSLGTMVIEAGRLQGARTQMDDANLSAGTSMIAAYNSTLYERYGLLAIDNDLFNPGRYKEYLEFNSDRTAGYMGNNISTFYVVNSVELEGMYNLTYPAVLKRQLLSRAKYHVVPQDYSLNYYNMDYFIADYQSKATYVSDALQTVASGTAPQGSLSDVPEDMQSALADLYMVFSKTKKYDEDYNVTIKTSDTMLLPSNTGTIEHSVYSEDMQAINDAVSDANTVLGANGALLESNNGSSYSEVDVSLNTSFASDVIGELADINQLPTKAVYIVSDCRSMVQEINAALNVLRTDKEGTLLLNSYIAGYFPNKNFTVDGYTGSAKGTAVSGVSNAAFSGACVEYVFSGNASETRNQQNAYDYIIATRLVNNLYSTITNSSSFNGNNASSVAAHIAWAYYETCADVELLFRYNAIVPFSKADMILPINNILAVKDAFAGRDFLMGMKALGIAQEDTSTSDEHDYIFVVDGYDTTNYRDALAFALWFVPNSEKMLRVADLIQLEMRFREQYVEHGTASFLMSNQNTFCRVMCTGKLNSILPVISLKSGTEVKGTSIQSIKYIGY